MCEKGCCTHGTVSFWVHQSSSSRCRRLLDLPFCVFFLNEAGPPSSPREVMTRSLNLGLGSGGTSVEALAVPPSTWGSCKSTLALEREEINQWIIAWCISTFTNQTALERVQILHLQWILLLLDLFPGPIWIGSFGLFGLWHHSCCLFLFLLLRFSCCALDLLLFFHLFSSLLGRFITAFIFSLLF